MVESDGDGRRIRDIQDEGRVETGEHRRLVIIGSLVRGCVFGGDMMNEGSWNNGLWNDGCPAVAESRKRATGQEVLGAFH